MTFASGKGRGAKYGAAHIAERKRRAAAHHPSHPCTRCRKPLGPMSSRLHLDHCECTGGCGRCAGTGYLGFAHAGCNVSAGASKGARTVNAQRERATEQTTFIRRVW